MSELIQDREGNDVAVYIAFHGGMVDAIVRADTQADFETAALSRNLMIEDEEGRRPWADGIEGSVLGPVEVTPATYDEDGNQLTAPVMDNRYHVNLRIHGVALTRTTDGFENWKQTAIDWTVHGTPDTNVNAEEQGVKLANVVLIDPATIKTPTRVTL